MYHSSDYGGYYHSTTASGGTVSHTGYNGTTTESYGAYYHQPATVGYYGAGCYGCGAAGWGAAAAVAGTAAVVGTAAVISTAAAVSANTAAAASANSAAAYNAGVAAGSASTAAAYSAGAAAAATFAALPDGCAFKPSGNTAYYFCAGSGLWLMPAYGANGLIIARWQRLKISSTFVATRGSRNQC